MTGLAEQGALAGTQEKKEGLLLLEEGHASQEEYRDLIRSWGDKIRKGIQPPELEDRDGEQKKPPIIQEEAVNDLLRHLETHKSVGPDGIQPRVLRELAEELAKPLSSIYHQSWLTGEVPDDWSLANVTPIYKKGRKEGQGNYRPVSLTSGKVMEQFILSGLTRQVQDNQGIRPSQHEFMKVEHRKKDALCFSLLFIVSSLVILLTTGNV
nr:PREDICTED: uncharacterized protein LOC104643050 [Balearica regulorum gibbericeps]